MNTENLDQFSKAYEGTSIYSFDNEIMLKWFVKRALELSEGSTCLELGIGYGYTTSMLSEKFEQCTVVEGSPEVIALFRKKYPNIKRLKIVEGYFEDFETNEQYDAILMGFILEHVADPALILSMYKKFLKPGGSIFIGVPNAKALNRRFGYEAGMLKDYYELSDHDLLLGHRRFYDLQSITEEVINCGYRIERQEGIYLKCMSTKQVLDLKVPTAIIDAMCKVGTEYPELSASLLLQIKAD